MTALIEVPAHEIGKVRVFAISMTQDELAGLSFSQMVNCPGMNPEHAELIAVSDLEGIGLAGYLTAGQGVPPEALASDKPKLAALDGSILLVFSAAFESKAQQFTPDPRLTLIGTYEQDQPDWTPTPLTSDSAAPFSAPPAQGKKPMSDARMSGMVATAVLVFLALFVYAFIKLAS